MLLVLHSPRRRARARYAARSLSATRISRPDPVRRQCAAMRFSPDPLFRNAEPVRDLRRAQKSLAASRCWSIVARSFSRWSRGVSRAIPRAGTAAGSSVSKTPERFLRRLPGDRPYETREFVFGGRMPLRACAPRGRCVDMAGLLAPERFHAGRNPSRLSWRARARTLSSSCWRVRSALPSRIFAPVPAQRAGRVGQRQPAENLMHEVAEGHLVASPRRGQLAGRECQSTARNEMSSRAVIVARPATLATASASAVLSDPSIAAICEGGAAPRATPPDHGLVTWPRAPASGPASAGNYQPPFGDAAWQKCEQLVPGELGEPAGGEIRRRRLREIDRPTSLGPSLDPRLSRPRATCSEARVFVRRAGRVARPASRPREACHGSDETVGASRRFTMSE